MDPNNHGSFLLRKGLFSAGFQSRIKHAVSGTHLSSLSIYPESGLIIKDCQEKGMCIRLKPTHRVLHHRSKQNMTRVNPTFFNFHFIKQTNKQTNKQTGKSISNANDYNYYFKCARNIKTFSLFFFGVLYVFSLLRTLKLCVCNC